MVIGEDLAVAVLVVADSEAVVEAEVVVEVVLEAAVGEAAR